MPLFTEQMKTEVNLGGQTISVYQSQHGLFISALINHQIKKQQKHCLLALLVPQMPSFPWLDYYTGQCNTTQINRFLLSGWFSKNPRHVRKSQLTWGYKPSEAHWCSSVPNCKWFPQFLSGSFTNLLNYCINFQSSSVAVFVISPVGYNSFSLPMPEYRIIN